jgi:CHAT domain-containing protein
VEPQCADDLIRLTEQKFDDAEQAIAALQAALDAEARLDHWPFAEDRSVARGRLLLRLGEQRLERQRKGSQRDRVLVFGLTPAQDHAIDVELMFAALIQARDAFADKAPVLWARAQHVLAEAYDLAIRDRRVSNPRSLIEDMIAACEAALTVRTHEVFPVDRAKTQSLLAIAYRNRRIGGWPGAENIERSIALGTAASGVLSREAFPGEWAQVQANLGFAYQLSIVRGDLAENIERSIAFFEAALTVYTRDAFPPEWAEAQVQLALLYATRLRGAYADNIERAIALLEETQTVLTRETYPIEWAKSRTALASAYFVRRHGVHRENIERAIALLDAALAVYSRDGMPLDRASTQVTLAQLHLDRIREPNVDIYHAPADADEKRTRRERQDNVERAIAYAEAALTVLTREDSPLAWANAQVTLAAAYARRRRVAGTENDDEPLSVFFAWQLENSKRAVAHYEAALTVYGPDVLPFLHLRTASQLGEVLMVTAFRSGKAADWSRAADVLAEAAKAFALLFGEGPSEAEACLLIELAGGLFANAAYAASELGRDEEAFELACEGRGRLLDVALRRQRLALSPERRQRLEALRGEIRAQTRLLDVSSGTERIGALDRLASLRRELVGLIEESDEALGQVGALALAGPLVANGDAVILPIATEVGGKLFLVTAGVEGSGLPRLAVRTVRTFTNRHLRSFMSGGERSLGWLDLFAPKLTRQRKTLVAELSDELWRLFAPSGIDGAIAALIDKKEEFGCSLPALLEELGLGRGARLMVLPTGGLGWLPLGLLKDRASPRRLIDDYEIVYGPSLEALSHAHEAAGQPVVSSLTEIVGPTGDLAYTPIEGKLVAGEFRGVDCVMLDEHDATPAAALAALKGKSYWHFSTHGSFDSVDARRSGLMMKDDARLTVGTLLEAEDLGRPRLVTLSACESGLHEIHDAPDEFIGLPGAFIAMGAAAVLGTLWLVSDLPAALLIGRFYQLHRRQALPPATALRQAQLWLRDARRSELAAYVDEAAKDGRLDAEEARRIQAALAGADESADAVRFPRGAMSGPASDSHDPGSERPYAHPVYWGGFILHGL